QEHCVCRITFSTSCSALQVSLPPDSRWSWRPGNPSFLPLSGGAARPILPPLKRVHELSVPWADDAATGRRGEGHCSQRLSPCPCIATSLRFGFFPGEQARRQTIRTAEHIRVTAGFCAKRSFQV